MESSEVNELLSQARPQTSEGADLLLDLRDLLLNDGHPGTCVQCFFSLLGNLDRPGSLTPLRIWLEEHLEVAVRINGETRERFPVRFGKSRNLQDYCENTFEFIRSDRSYQEDKIHLSFQYRVAMAA
ncbi:hypothetical protein [Roseibacillus persicicus]|uniref:Uncharacterized protein n=1 Tax=Roseibacillus persicicus TaxID=454148 RepID=A0A918TJJ0_9BACT|nr:hypothetical protein [Roseibacillus persicicus]MDQ8190037.1 hypothetical protein [Roseibacillus persicicus]GHC50634.1 hypothetical protein GCM10007100_15900 [Roseibacillus persicicus]